MGRVEKAEILPEEAEPILTDPVVSCSGPPGSIIIVNNQELHAEC